MRISGVFKIIDIASQPVICRQPVLLEWGLSRRLEFTQRPEYIKFTWENKTLSHIF
jgi:hypothetical protein